MVMIGIDPHKRTHTAVALSASGLLGSRLVPAEVVRWPSCVVG